METLLGFLFFMFEKFEQLKDCKCYSAQLSVRVSIVSTASSCENGRSNQNVFLWVSQKSYFSDFFGKSEKFDYRAERDN